MKCIITGGNVKALGKAVHSLSRIGDEVYIEPLKEGLSLRAVNASRSAYACFLFAPLFFQHYAPGESRPVPDAGPVRCKVLMKSFLAVFRSLSLLEKTVEKCLISLRFCASRLRVQLHCKYGVIKTHDLLFQECESLQAVFDTEQCTHTLRAPPRLLVDAVVHFPLTLAEVTMSASPGGKVTFRSYLEEEPDPLIDYVTMCLLRHNVSKVSPVHLCYGRGDVARIAAGGKNFFITDSEAGQTMLTELCLSEDEFQVFHVKEETQVTFCLKEFRGLLSFAESSSLPLNVHFDSPGRPAIFTLEDPLLEVQLVLATLSETDSHSSQMTSCTAKAVAPAYDFTNDDIDAYMIAMETTCAGMDQACPSPSPTFPTRCTSSDTKDLDNDHEETVPGTPPQKKFRSLFFGSVLNQSQTLPYPGSGQEVLAEDSEGES